MTLTVKMQCERDEASFIGVSAIIRFVSPTKSRLRASSCERAGCADRFFKWTLPSSSSKRLTLCGWVGGVEGWGRGVWGHWRA